MPNNQSRRLAALFLLLVGCGAKVVFVGPDDGEATDTTPSYGGGSLDNGFCERYCTSEQDPCSEQRNTESCFDWCRERQTNAGKCSGSWELEMECGHLDCADCPYPQALRLCAFGCTAEPDCVEEPNQTTCRVTCASDFEWSCTAGPPSTCTCLFNGEVVGTCSYEYEPTQVGCCDGVFAETHV